MVEVGMKGSVSRDAVVEKGGRGPAPTMQISAVKLPRVAPAGGKGLASACGHTVSVGIAMPKCTPSI